MSRRRTLLCALYAAISLVALVTTWRQNLGFAIESANAGGMNGFVPALLVNRASISITVDILLFFLAAVFFMLREARRLGIRFAYLYVLFGGLVAISVTFPLFLIARERRLHELEGEASDTPLTAGDLALLVALGLLTVGCSLYSLTLGGAPS